MKGVDVYFNLHRMVWSIRSRTTGLVEAHRRVVYFPHGAGTVVRAAGRAKVLETGQKNVHAFVRGADHILSDDVRDWAGWAENVEGLTGITYNPHRAGYFTRRDNGERIDSASLLIMIAPEGKPPAVWAVPT